jgi:hypothetical protein
MRVLTDDDKNHAKPTRAEMIKAFQWLVDGAKENDSLFLHYSGHGGSQKDVDPNTDEADGIRRDLVPGRLRHRRPDRRRRPLQHARQASARWRSSHRDLGCVPLGVGARHPVPLHD